MKIIGGSAKGTLLSSPAGRNTRPTLGRVRESVFNVLANVGILETKVLDIFAGTGAMGLEALSRGAGEAVFLDKATGAIIRENALRCHVADRSRILKGDVSSSLKTLRGQKFDYIFMDPPYRKGYINEVLQEVTFRQKKPSLLQNTLYPNRLICLFSRENASCGKRKKWGPLL